MGAFLSKFFSPLTKEPSPLTKEPSWDWLQLDEDELRESSASLALKTIKGHDGWHSLNARVFYGPNNVWNHGSKESPQTSGELQIISIHRKHITSEFESHPELTEFGPGDGDKTMEMLGLHKGVKKYRMVGRNILAMLSLQEKIAKLYPHIKTEIWQGEFKQAISHAINNGIRLGCSVSLGSTLLHDSPEANDKTLRDLAKISDKIIIGQDGNTDEQSIFLSYTTRTFKDFIKQGCKEFDKILNSVDKVFDRAVLRNNGWTSRVQLLHMPALHIALDIAAEKDMEFIFHEDTAEQEKVIIKKGTLFRIFRAYKYNQESIESMAAKAGYVKSATYSVADTESRIHVFIPPNDASDDRQS